MAFARGIYQWPLISPHREPVTRKLFSFDDVIMPAPRASDVKLKYLIYREMTQTAPQQFIYP